MELQEQFLNRLQNNAIEILEERLQAIKEISSLVNRHQETTVVIGMINMAFELGILSEESKDDYLKKFDHVRIYGNGDRHPVTIE